ncbi:MAG: PQQ-dependent sugar dehydrogenase [Methanothrix sp.]|nr:PQQ-dependent sugar dehydrogenase [Methanothrix sp.]
MLLILTAGITGCVEKMPPQTNVVEIKNFSFQPSSITVSPGTIVTWVNNDPVEHTVTSSDGIFKSGNMATGGLFNFTFSKPGKYQYQCSIHPSMVGYVIVASGQTDAGKVNATGPGSTEMKNVSNSMTNQSAPVVGLKLVASGFAAPMEFISTKDGRMFVVDQIGLVKVITADGTLQEKPFLNISDRMVKLSPTYDERGLLGLAFHPDFALNGRVFVYYSAPLRSGAPEGWSCTNNLSEFLVSKDDRNLIDMNSEKVLLQIDKPQMNHNGGTIAFGPDGYLYLPLGDGGGANDVGMGHVTGGNAQNTSILLGKILRIDVNVNNASAAYGIPADNPFVNEKGFLPEIWAYGLRNPYRISFDSAGRLFVADAGQNLWEEVDLISKGGNYGWNLREGTHCFDPNSPKESPASCPDIGRKGEPLLGPVIEYDHNNRTVVVGGYVYEGKALMPLAGSYVFADWSSSFAKGDGKLYMANPAGEGLWKMEEIRVADRPGGRINEYIRSIGQDDEGELYVLTSEVGGPSGETGKIYKMVPSAK